MMLNTWLKISRFIPTTAFVLACSQTLLAGPALAGPAEDAYNRGLDLKGNGKIPAAIRSFDQAISLNPKYKDAYGTRAVLLNLLGQHQKAADDCTQIITLDPGNIQFLTLRGRLYYKLGKYQQAVVDLTRVISITPRNGEALLFRCQAYEKLGKPDLARQDQEKAAQLGFKPGMF